MSANPYRPDPADIPRPERQALPHTSFAFQTRCSGRLVCRYVTGHLRRANVPAVSTQIDVLAIIQLYEDTNTHLRELAWQLGVHPSTLSRSISRLEARGLVCRVTTLRDRRVHVPRLTTEGARVLAEARAVIAAVVQPRLQFKLHPASRLLRTESVRIVRRIREQMRDEVWLPDDDIHHAQWCGIPYEEAMLRHLAATRNRRRYGASPPG